LAPTIEGSTVLGADGWDDCLLHAMSMPSAQTVTGSRGKVRFIFGSLPPTLPRNELD